MPIQFNPYQSPYLNYLTKYQPIMNLMIKQAGNPKCTPADLTAQLKQYLALWNHVAKFDTPDHWDQSVHKLINRDLYENIISIKTNPNLQIPLVHYHWYSQTNPTTIDQQFPQPAINHYLKCGLSIQSIIIHREMTNHATT